MKKILIPIILVLTQFNLSLFAQSSITKNDTIRITAPAFYLYPLMVKFESLNSDSITFEFNASSYTLSLNEINNIETQSGFKRNTLIGAVIGGIVGGLFLGLLVENDSRNSDFKSIGNTQMGFKDGFLAGGLLGALSGGLVGYFYKTETWEKVSLPYRTY